MSAARNAPTGRLPEHGVPGEHAPGGMRRADRRWDCPGGTAPADGRRGSPDPVRRARHGVPRRAPRPRVLALPLWQGRMARGDPLAGSGASVRRSAAVRHVRTRAPLRNDRGAAAVEVVTVIPVLLVLIVGVATVWRVWWADSQLTAATAAAARAAAHATSAGQARTAASRILESDLAASGITCRNSPVLITVTTPFDAPLAAGQSGRVSLTTACVVSLRQAGVPGLPGTVTLGAEATETIDTYREHGG